MLKYEVKYALTETIPKKINDFLLNLIFLELKRSFLIVNGDKIKQMDLYKDLDGDFFLTYAILNLGTSSEKNNKYYKKILNRLNYQGLLKKYIRHICNSLQEKEYSEVNKLLNSLVCSGLVKKAELVKRDVQDYIILTLLNDKKVKFSHMPLNNEIISECRGRCHHAVSYFIKDDPNSRRALVTLEKNTLFGKMYHSIMVEDNVVYDFAQNIMISYKNYFNLFEPKVLVNERGSELIKNMQSLKEKLNYRDSEWADLIVYGISKQLH